MANTVHSYTKLPGRGLRTFTAGVTATHCRLWLGEDHLLAVDATFINEDYRRFYFRDIEALIIRRTARRQIVNWIFLALGLVLASPFFFAWVNDRSAEPLLITSVICLLCGLFVIVVNSLRGPTCETHIRTAAQLEQLPSLNRISVARKVLARLQPHILAVQGKATPEELAAASWTRSL